MQPVLRIVTDVNLRSVEKVHKVLECLKLDSSATESHSNGGSEDVVQIDAGAGVNPHAHLDRELWLREVGRKGDEKFVRWWVDHRRGTAGIEEVEDDAEDRKFLSALFFSFGSDANAIVWVCRSRHGVPLLDVHGGAPRAHQSHSRCEEPGPRGPRLGVYRYVPPSLYVLVIAS